MSVYFIFSDEHGNYLREPTDKQRRKEPYYIRSCILIDGNEWKNLNTQFNELFDTHGIPKVGEVKWNQIWPLRNYQRNNDEIPADRDFYFLRNTDYHNVIDFVEGAIGLLSKLNYAKCILTITFNNHGRQQTETIYRFHLQELMQRIQMELQDDENNLGVLFIDPLNKEKNQFLREAYHSLYSSGDLIENYSHIKDSLNFEFSHHSVGIQIADFIAGCTSGMLKGYSRSQEIFRDHVLPVLRKNGDKIMGYGIREVPSSRVIRRQISESVQNAWEN